MLVLLLEAHRIPESYSGPAKDPLEARVEPPARGNLLGKLHIIFAATTVVAKSNVLVKISMNGSGSRVTVPEIYVHSYARTHTAAI